TGRPFSCLARGAAEGLDLRDVLDARRAFEARGRIDQLRSRRADRLGDVVRREAAGEAPGHRVPELREQRPVERETGASGQLLCRGVVEQAMRRVLVALRALEVVDPADTDRLPDLQR